MMRSPIGSQPNLSWVCSTNEIWLISNKGIAWIKIHPLTRFCFYPVMFLLYIFFIIVYFHMKYYKLFPYSKNSSTPTTPSQMWGYNGKWCYLGNYVMSQWVGDIAIPNNHVTNNLDLSHKIQENLDILHKIQVVGKPGHFSPKTWFRINVMVLVRPSWSLLCFILLSADNTIICLRQCSILCVIHAS